MGRRCGSSWSAAAGAAPGTRDRVPTRLPAMSVAFVPDWLRGKAQVNQETIQRVSAAADNGKGFLSREPEGPRVQEASRSGRHPSRDLVPTVLTRWVRWKPSQPGCRGRTASHWAVRPWAGYLTSRCPVALTLSLLLQLLEENDQLIRCIVEYQNKGRANECVQ